MCIVQCRSFMRKEQHEEKKARQNLSRGSPYVSSVISGRLGPHNKVEPDLFSHDPKQNTAGLYQDLLVLHLTHSLASSGLWFHIALDHLACTQCSTLACRPSIRVGLITRSLGSKLLPFACLFLLVHYLSKHFSF